MTVAELDPIIRRYVVIENDMNIGEKAPEFGYLKSEWTKGRFRGFKTFEERVYKQNPP